MADVRMGVANIPHGFSWSSILIVVLLGLIAWLVGYGIKITPQVRSTANQVANLNNLQKVDVHCQVHPLARTIDCIGNL